MNLVNKISNFFKKGKLFSRVFAFWLVRHWILRSFGSIKKLVIEREVDLVFKRFKFWILNLKTFSECTNFLYPYGQRAVSKEIVIAVEKITIFPKNYSSKDKSICFVIE